MRKFFFIGLFVIATSATLVAFAAEPPENITIDGCKDTKAAVEFPHQAHFEAAACIDCHHTTEGLTAETAADMEVATCASCHLEPEAAETPKCGDKSSKTNPFHISCVGCHKTYKKEHADTTAPTKCKACHPKEG